MFATVEKCYAAAGFMPGILTGCPRETPIDPCEPPEDQQSGPRGRRRTASRRKTSWASGAMQQIRAHGRIAEENGRLRPLGCVARGS